MPIKRSNSSHIVKPHTGLYIARMQWKKYRKRTHIFVAQKTKIMYGETTAINDRLHKQRIFDTNPTKMQNPKTTTTKSPTNQLTNNIYISSDVINKTREKHREEEKKKTNENK